MFALIAVSLEDDRLKKLQESPRVSKETPRVSREAVNVDVERTFLTLGYLD